MIVKLRTDRIDEPKRTELKNWVFFDGFRKVKVTYVPIKTLYDSDNINYMMVNSKFKDDTISVMLICTKRDNDTEYIIGTTEEVYILNDDGKTIERLG